MKTSKIINDLPKLQMLQIEESLGAFIAASASESAVALLPCADAKALQRLIACYQMPSDERISVLAGLRDALAPYVPAAPYEKMIEESLRRTELEFEAYNALIRAGRGSDYRDPDQFKRDMLEVHRRCRSGAEVASPPARE